MDEVVRDDEDPDAEVVESRVAPALHVPGPVALVFTQPAKQASRVIPRLSQSAKRAPVATTSRVRCSDFDTPPDAQLWDVRRPTWPRVSVAISTRAEGASANSAVTFMRPCQ